MKTWLDYDWYWVSTFQLLSLPPFRRPFSSYPHIFFGPPFLHFTAHQNGTWLALFEGPSSSSNFASLTTYRLPPFFKNFVGRITYILKMQESESTKWHKVDKSKDILQGIVDKGCCVSFNIHVCTYTSDQISFQIN